MEKESKLKIMDRVKKTGKAELSDNCIITDDTIYTNADQIQKFTNEFNKRFLFDKEFRERKIAEHKNK